MASNPSIVTPIVNGVTTSTYNQDPSPIVIGSYAQRVMDKVNGARVGTNEDGSAVGDQLGGQNGARLTNQVDIYQVQLVIDFYENIKNSVAIPSTDTAPTIPITAQPPAVV